MSKVPYLVATIVTLVAGPCAAQQPVPVRVGDGFLRGTSEDGVTVYKK